LNSDNLRAAKVGEPYNARFYEVTTIRKKKPGENLQGGSLSQGIWTTNPLGVPGGSRAAQVTLLVTVEAIDEANGTVTVKAADGTTETVKAREPQNLKLLKVGDELVVSLYEVKPSRYRWKSSLAPRTNRRDIEGFGNFTGDPFGSRITRNCDSDQLSASKVSGLTLMIASSSDGNRRHS
jgi:hypothetical protein